MEHVVYHNPPRASTQSTVWSSNTIAFYLRQGLPIFLADGFCADAISKRTWMWMRLQQRQNDTTRNNHNFWAWQLLPIDTGISNPTCPGFQPKLRTIDSPETELFQLRRQDLASLSLRF